MVMVMVMGLVFDARGLPLLALFPDMERLMDPLPLRPRELLTLVFELDEAVLQLGLGGLLGLGLGLGLGRSSPGRGRGS